MTNCECSYCQRQRRMSPDDRTANDKLLDVKEQCAFLGGKSHMFLKRRAADPDAHFPDMYYVGRAPMRYLTDLAAWAASPHARTPEPRRFGRGGIAAD